jgi:hypothetical protein
MSACLTPESLLELIARAVPEPAFAAFSEQLARCRPDWKLTQFLSTYSAAARTLGRHPMGERADTTCISTGNGELPLIGMSSDCAGRIWLLCALAKAVPTELATVLEATYDEGDSLEKIAVIRSLALLPFPERFVEIARDAGRGNEVSTFGALACNNPYPARFYPELAWNQLYMKAVFMDLPLAQMVGARERDNAELSRMALQYIEQQESAGRRFPADLFLSMAAFPPPGAVAKLLGYASHAVAELRLGAAEGLARVRQPRTLSFLHERLPLEADANVREALTRAIAALPA